MTVSASDKHLSLSITADLCESLHQDLNILPALTRFAFFAGSSLTFCFCVLVLDRWCVVDLLKLFPCKKEKNPPLNENGRSESYSQCALKPKQWAKTCSKSPRSRGVGDKSLWAVAGYYSSQVTKQTPTNVFPLRFLQPSSHMITPLIFRLLPVWVYLPK